MSDANWKKPFEERDFGIEYIGGKPTGKSVASAWAQWFIGHRDWANQIIGAYEHPEIYLSLLKKEVEK